MHGPMPPTQEAERLRGLCRDMMALLDEMPIKYPQQADRRNALRARMRREALGAKRVSSVVRASKRLPMCEGCGVHRSDPPSHLCVGCQAYQDHQR
jgi:hypothetical protein